MLVPTPVVVDDGTLATAHTAATTAGHALQMLRGDPSGDGGGRAQRVNHDDGASGYCDRYLETGEVTTRPAPMPSGGAMVHCASKAATRIMGRRLQLFKLKRAGVEPT
jgi:hypothetical protein